MPLTFAVLNLFRSLRKHGFCRKVMAKPPVSCWVYKKLHKYRYLPRPLPIKHDYERMLATPEHFEDKLPNPPKLWVAWVYKSPFMERKVKEMVVNLFGREYQLNEMKVFKNTPYWNRLLWNVKHLIEIYPITFPNGEPTAADVGNVRLLPTGECLVDPKFAVDEHCLKMSDPKNWTEITEGRMQRRATRRFSRCLEVQEDAPWTLQHRSDF